MPSRLVETHILGYICKHIYLRSMSVIQLIALLLVLVALRTLLPIHKKAISIFVSFFLALIFAIQLSSVLLTGEIADYRFYENFNLNDVLSVADFFGKEGILLTSILAITTFLIHHFGSWIRRTLSRKIIPLVVLVGGIGILSINGGILFNVYTTLQLKFSADASFNEVLSTLKIDEKAYITKNEIKATRGKNIVVLSLESLEKGYLGEKLRHLTPNLTHLAKEYTLLPMEQSPAGGWTSASMYIAVTGVPAYFGTHGNSVFQSSHENKLTTLPDVLKNAGYDLQYFIGKKEYSGIDDLLKTHGFTVKSEKDFTTKYEPVSWGIQDMDLFGEFKKEILLKKKSEQPFALFLSTIGTHFPNGVPDKRINSLLPPQRSRLELMASATDYFVGDLIDFLQTEGLLSNTVFFIYPDHLLMGSTSEVVGDFDERSLYLLTNADPSKLGVSPDTGIFQIDIPKLILKGAGVKHNAKFLTDFIPEGDKNTFLRKNAKSLLQLNDAALTTLNLQDGIFISLDKKKEKFSIANEKGIILITEVVTRQGMGQRITIDEEMKPLDLIPFDFSKPKVKVKTPFYLDVFWSDGNLYASLKDKNNLGLLKKGAEEIVFTEEEIKMLSSVQVGENVKSTTNGIVLNSNSWNAKKVSNFSIGDTTIPISRGITLVAFNAQNRPDYKTYDTYGSIEDAQTLVATISEFKKNKVPFALLAHDSAAKSLERFSEELDNLGLKKLSVLKNRQAYIAQVLNGEIIEKVDDTGILIQLSPLKNLKNTKLYFTGKVIEFEPKVDRYIAHAGGEIDGVKYTNSKDALDYSYEQGFRMFELDIIETSDGQYVAAHDWNHWKKETQYHGNVPVSLSEFRKYKIRDKYQAMGLAEINRWFAAHPDAILVTDKVNTPIKFAQQFVDKKRLIMELFDLNSVQRALQNTIAPIVSEKVMAEIKSDIVTYLLENEIKYVGLSRRSIDSKKELLQKCRDNGIKVYVYHVNFDSGRDERYVLENEIGLVYGMYADKWLSAFGEKKKK